mgnify:CR=1 FL=1
MLWWRSATTSTHQISCRRAHAETACPKDTAPSVIGSLTGGNGDPALCVFGEQVTPNQHKMVRECVLLDNTYCCGILSADGHQWSTTAFATDYVERSFAG